MDNSSHPVNIFHRIVTPHRRVRSLRVFLALFYCFDFFVVTVSLGLEISFLILHETQVEFLVGLLILGRLWRFVRIGHGIFEATYELSTREQHERAEYTKKLEELCRANGLELPTTPEAEQT